ncbi:MAG: hypothetical protein GY832_08020 [Chloroflexi bacterium]|nr:hypothetical protein [Chloroflexota bacterium]
MEFPNSTPQTSKVSAHLWIAFFTILALAAMYVGGVFAGHQSSVEAGPLLTPVFSIPSGYYDQDIQLTISIPNSHAQVIFTADGSLPTHTVGTVYGRPIHLSTATPAVTVIRARAVLPDGELGPVVSASYFVGVPAKLPMISLIIDPSDLWDVERGIYVNFDGRGNDWERAVDVTYVDQDHRSGFHIPAGVRIHGGGSRRFDKKALRLYFRQEYGGSKLAYPLFADGNANSNVQSFKRLVLHNGGQDGMTLYNMNWTLIRNQLVDNLAFQLGGYATRSQPVLLFVNGDSWGIYQIRERIDSRFLMDHYRIESADYLDTPEHAWDQTILMGDRQHWDHLLQFVETHDLAYPAHYAYVQSQVDIANFIDYHILYIYAANVDWPFHNIQQFRPRVQGGRWQWLFWDNDRTFGARPVRPYSRVDWNSVEQLQTFDHYLTNGREVLLWRKLLENPVFLQRFLSRTVDLLNTTLAPTSVIAHIDVLAAELEPDIAYETIRWASSTNWKSNVQELRDFARFRPDFVRQHVVEHFDLNGTAQLFLNPPTSGSGYVAVNGYLARDLPWQGIYFQGIPVRITAVPAPGYHFAGWDPPSLPQTPIITLTVETSQKITPRFEIVDESMPRPGDVVLTGYPSDENSHITGSYFELYVMRSGGIDLRGWRVTDNDTKTATDEGSLIFSDHPAFAHVPQGTTIQIVFSPLLAGKGEKMQDDVNTPDRLMVLHASGSYLDTDIDPGFNLGANDNLVLLAPGPTGAFDDDRGISFVTTGDAVTPASFGVLVDGVLPVQH